MDIKQFDEAGMEPATRLTSRTAQSHSVVLHIRHNTVADVAEHRKTPLCFTPLNTKNYYIRGYGTLTVTSSGLPRLSFCKGNLRD